MIVLDSSAAIELLLRPVTVPQLSQKFERGEDMYVPDVFHLEVMNVLRKHVRDKIITVARCELVLHQFFAIKFLQVDTKSISGRIWQLRDNMTAYDAAYIAIAEALAIPLYTHDKKLTGSVGHQAEIVVV